MAITVNIYYHGQSGQAQAFAKEMISSGIVEGIRKEKGNLRYDYFIPFDDPDTILLIDSWTSQEAIDHHHQSSQEAIDHHHQSPWMAQIMTLREKYDLTMDVERFISDDEIPEYDQSFIRK